MHAEQPVAALDPLERDRVVEVAGVDGIDRDDGPPGEVAPVALDRLGEPLGLPPRVGRDRVGKRTRQGELVDHRLRVDARRSRRAEHLHDHAFAVAHVRGKPHHLHDDLVFVAGALRPRIAHGHGPGKAGAIDLHPAGAGGLEIAADKPRRLPLHHLDDLARGARAAGIAGPGESHPHRVARGGIERGVGRDMNVG